MRFQIWCTVHDCAVIAADGDANLVLKVPTDPVMQDEFEIDESNLYCLDEGDHEFIMKLPAPTYDPKVDYAQKLVDEGIARKTDRGIVLGEFVDGHGRPTAPPEGDTA